MDWTRTLLFWYDENKRTFPWRETKEPYKVWLSEIILQQTRTQQGLPYFRSFLEAFPTLKDLALASEDSILKLWQGLGYYSRARNLHATAQYIYKECEGVFPITFDKLLSLKGVGDYTASAISSICYNLPEAVVDGNVYRFLSRYFAIDTPVDSNQAHQLFKTKASSLMDKTQSGKFNQALMEFGALQCIPKNPSCSICPFVKKCIAFNQKKINFYPVKKARKKKIDRYFNYLIIRDKNGKVKLEKRLGKGIWQNLFQFPLIETHKMINTRKKLIENIPKTNLIGLDLNKLKLCNSDPIIHKLSHQKLNVFFWIIPSKKTLKNGFTLSELKTKAVPVVIQNFIDFFFTVDP